MFWHLLLAIFLTPAAFCAAGFIMAFLFGLSFAPALSSDYIPTKDADLDAWATNFDTVITAAPTSYGLIAGQATAFHTLRLAFTNALATAVNPATRTPVTVALKDTARAQAVALARQLGQVAQRYPSITDGLLASAGLTVRDPIPSPIPAPVSTPVMSLLSSDSLSHVLRYHDSILANPRGKPPGAVAMQLFAKVGPGAPADISDCVFIGQFSKMPAVAGGGGSVFQFDPTDAGKTIYYLSRWVTATGKLGPTSAQFAATLPA